MNNKLNYEKWFENAIFEKKFEALEFLINKNKNLTISLENNEITEHTKSLLNTTIIRGLYQEKKSDIYLEKINDNMMEKVLNDLKNQIKFSNLEGKDDIFDGSECYYHNVETNNFDFSKIELKKKYKLLLDLSEKLSKHHLFSKIENISYSETYFEKKIINSKNLNIRTEENFAEIYIICIFQKNNKIEEISEHFLVKNFKEFNIDEYVKKILEKGEKKINACSLKSDIYDTVFSNKTFAKLLRKFSSIFSGINVHRDLSKLKNKIDCKIASEKVNIIDDPIESSAFFKYKFDDEGVPGKKKIIIEKGILRQFIHNLKTSNIFKTLPTGNFFDNQINMSNCYLKKGSKSIDQIILKIKKGVFINNLIGLHAGINEITGDFSIQAEGFKIEKGKISSPVKMIVVSGNFFNLLNNIKAIANDFEFDFSGFGSASVYVGELSIAGEK
ncbi:metallopeptidase TldD-related protein [Candidatus Phytoplasma sacchari]|nr:metallopeptidase TldD-related protein [Candidatus Phytoplasma sacchari]KAB8122317.1 TldD/PmbA family protein [Candidatus Phytoplasma sacchari]